MKPINFIRSSEKKKILEELENLYGVTSLPYILAEAGKKKIRAFSGTMSREEIQELTEITNVEVIGMYMISQKDDDLRINFDALPLFKEQITKSIIEINEEQFNCWIRGQDLDIETKKGTFVISHKGDLIGIGKSNGIKIFNYIPKERKLKTQMPKLKI